VPALKPPKPRDGKSRGLVLGTVLWAFLCVPLGAQGTASKEYQVKAVFLFNFTQFVQWSPEIFGGAEKPFGIGILGEDPFGEFLDQTVKGEKVDGHPLVVRRFHRLEEVKDCQILFIGRSEKPRMGNLLAGLRDRSILTVGETDGFVEGGGIIVFFMKQNKIHFKVNPKAAKVARLKISSKMLRLAEIFEPGKD